MKNDKTNGMEMRRKQKKIGVIGGGAAGMTAAIFAARMGAEVTILEAGERLGQKLLSTGNGKCNMGNANLSSGRYHGHGEFLDKCFSKFGTKETMDFFQSLGLLIKDKNGYLYPLCEQASAVLDVLRFEIAAKSVRVLYGSRVEGLDALKSGGFCARGRKGDGCFEERFDAVILTTGGKAMPKTGSDGSGYEIAKKLGHRIIPVVPALTSLTCSEDYFKSIAGVRTEGQISVLDENGRILRSDRGELQLTDHGISGIPAFQVSSTVSYELRRRKCVEILIDLLPSLTEEDVRRLAYERKRLRVGRTVEEALTGLLPKKLTALMIKRAGLRGTDPALVLTDGKVLSFIREAKKLRVRAVATGNFQSCQVCAGGVDVREITDSMESRLAKGVYFAGEVLDVDGECGGYNLQWAWTSGYLAAMAAAERNDLS